MISATLFEWTGRRFDCKNVDLLAELEERLCCTWSSRYGKTSSRAFFARRRDTYQRFGANASQIGACSGVRGHVIRSDGRVFLEMKGAVELSQPARALDKTPPNGYHAWRKRVTDLPWHRQMELVRDTFHDLIKLGESLAPAHGSAVAGEPVQYLSGHGRVVNGPVKPSQLLKTPFQQACLGRVSVFDAERLLNPSELNGLGQRLAQSPLIQGHPEVVLSDECQIDDGCLIVLPPLEPIPLHHPSLQKALAMERQGRAFRLVNRATLADRFALENLVLSLAISAGAIPWKTRLQRDRRILAIDAGHLTGQVRQSRWACCHYATATGDHQLRVADSPLQENLTDASARLLENDGGVIDEIWRDGRLHSRDMDLITDRVADTPVYELVKKPGVLLFRGSLSAPEPPREGDMFQHQTGSLIQMGSITDRSASPHILRVRGPVDRQWSQDVLALARRPLRSAFRDTYLPAPMYYADLASKLDYSKWLGALGHGWRLPAVESA